MANIQVATAPIANIFSQYGNPALVNDCRYSRRDLAGLEKALCFRLSHYIYSATVLAIVIGSLFCLFGCCGFFTLELAKARPAYYQPQYLDTSAIPLLDTRAPIQQAPIPVPLAMPIT